MKDLVRILSILNLQRQDFEGRLSQLNQNIKMLEMRLEEYGSGLIETEADLLLMYSAQSCRNLDQKQLDGLGIKKLHLIEELKAVIMKIDVVQSQLKKWRKRKAQTQVEDVGHDTHLAWALSQRSGECGAKPLLGNHKRKPQVSQLRLN